jgi:hypothetical protein
MNLVPGILLGLFLMIFWGGYVASVLWGWFVVPLGVSSITFWHAAGLMCVTRAFVGSCASSNDEAHPGLDIWKEVFLLAMMPLVLLAIGWLAKLNMS